MLETNHHLLSTSRGRTGEIPDSVTIVEPVRIGEDVTVSDSTIGPNVTIEDGATVTGSTLSHCIVGAGASVQQSTLTQTLVGDEAVVSDQNHENMVIAHDEIGPAR